MQHSSMPHHADVPQPGTLKRKIDFSMSDESDVDLVGEDYDFQILDISRHIDDELKLEVAIRERLATTIEGRIQWALQMLDALSDTKEPQDQSADGDDFQDAALDALDALESSSSFIFDTGLPEERSPSPSFSPIQPIQPAPQRAPKTRSSRTPKPSQQKKHLYLRLPSNTSDSQLIILACPTCSRTQFTTLQGLLNHARLAHGIEWASHDACITACAVPVSTDTQDTETLWTDGVEVPWGGSVVGLRRLFERAVGVDGVLPTPPSAYATSDTVLEDPMTAPSTLLSRTLGLHADSPALAQFLGRAPKRRCIHAHDEDQHVDIITVDGASSLPDRPFIDGPTQRHKGFCMRYPHRSTARTELDFVDDTDPATTVNSDSTPTCAVIPAGTTASRFHIMARIRLEDRSLFLKEDLRTQLGITDQYRWMLAVTAPSYSLPLSSFLTCITVAPPRTASPVFLTAQQQPFAVVGTANEPFMARVAFEWVGGGKMEVEHWVELDQSRSYTSVFGSEQLLDVELDRNTPLLPFPKGGPPPLPSLDRQLTLDSLLHDTLQSNTEHGDNSTVKEEYYEQVLRSLLPRVPMTAKDVKPRTTTQVPYKLASTPAHLLALVPGRRKAIEWARARALHALYAEQMAAVPPCQQFTLTVGDVYMFLEDASYFPRPLHHTLDPPLDPKRKGREKDGTPILGEESCPSCGFKKRLHPGYDIKREERAVNWTCAVVPTMDQLYGTKLPLTNLTKVLSWPDGLEQAVRGPPLSSPSSFQNQVSRIFLPPCRHIPRDVMALSPPDFILAVHKVVSKLRLPSFPDFAPYEESSAFLTNKESTERCLAAAALLSATLKPFISTLLHSATEVAKRDATSIGPGSKSNRGKRVKKLTYILTPGHILRGLRLQSNSIRSVPTTARTAMSCTPRARESTMLCLSRLGVQPDFGRNIQTKIGTDDVGHSMGDQATVKVEPE